MTTREPCHAPVDGAFERPTIGVMDKQSLYAVDPASLAWQKSRLTADNGECFELAPLPDGGVALRDSKNPDHPHLCFTAGEWAAFKGGMALGDFGNL